MQLLHNSKMRNIFNPQFRTIYNKLFHRTTAIAHNARNDDVPSFPTITINNHKADTWGYKHQSLIWSSPIVLRFSKQESGYRQGKAIAEHLFVKGRSSAWSWLNTQIFAICRTSNQVLKSHTPSRNTHGFVNHLHVMYWIL